MIELLESRIAPAGIIDLKLVNGLLTAKTLAAGDGEENVVFTQVFDSQVRVDPAAGTRVQFDGQLLADGELINIFGVTGLSISLGAGNDTLSIVNARLTKSLHINLGAGANNVTLSNGDVNGNFTLQGGPSADTVNIGGIVNFSVGGKTTIKLGEGNNVFSSTVPNFTVGKDFLLTSGSAADEVIWTGERLSFASKFTAQTGAGADAVRLTPTESVLVGRNLTVTNVNIDPAAVVIQQIAPSGDLTIGGNVKLAAKSGDVLQELKADTGAMAISGNVSFAMGIGKSVQRIDSAKYLTVLGNIAATTKAQVTASVTITNGLSPEGSFIGGSVSLLGHQNVQYQTGANITGALTITTGLGLAASVNVGFDLSEGVRIGGKLTVTTLENTGASSTISVVETTVAGATKITSGNGNTTAVLNDSVFVGAVTANLGAGSDTFRVEDLNTSGVTSFYAAVTVRGGDGADTFKICGSTGADVLSFRSTVLFDGGAGTDTITQGNTPTTVTPITLMNFE